MDKWIFLTEKKGLLNLHGLLVMVDVTHFCQVMCHYPEANTGSLVESNKQTILVWDLHQFTDYHHCPSIINE